MRQNAPATPRVHKSIIVNLSAYRTAIARRVERYALVPREWRAPAVRLVCQTAVRSWHVMRPVVEPEPNDPAWVAQRLAEGRLVWRLGMDRSCVAWPVRSTCRTLLTLLRAVEGRDPKVPTLATRALASARHGDIAAMLRIEREIGELGLRNELDADLDRPLCDPAAVVVGSAIAPKRTGQLVWHRCTTLRTIGELGTALGNCLAHVNRSLNEYGRGEALAGQSEIWGLYDGGTAVAAVRLTRDQGWSLSEVRGPRNAGVGPLYHDAVAMLWAWHAAHEDGSHAPDWSVGQLLPSFLEGPDGVRSELFHGEQLSLEEELRHVIRGRHRRRHYEADDLTPAHLRDTPAVRQALRAAIDPARDWALDPPQLDLHSAVERNGGGDGRAFPRAA